MQSKSETNNQLDSNGAPSTSIYYEPWWRGMGYNTFPLPVVGGNASSSTSLEFPNGGSESNDGQSVSNNDVNDEEDDVSKEVQATGSPHSGTSFNPYLLLQILSPISTSQSLSFCFVSDNIESILFEGVIMKMERTTFVELFGETLLRKENKYIARD